MNNKIRNVAHHWGRDSAFGVMSRLLGRKIAGSISGRNDLFCS